MNWYKKAQTDDISDEDDSGIDLGSRTAVTSYCARSTGASCTDDSDCKEGGCGGELCYNPDFGVIPTTCDCEAPEELFCGCVNNTCSWWY